MKTRKNIARLNQNKHIKFESVIHKKTIHKNNSRLYGLVKFQKLIVPIFFEILLMIKLYHWNTFSYSTHKATDELYGRFNENMDRFMEVLLGKTSSTGQRIHGITSYNTPIRLVDLDNKEELIKKIGYFKSYLVNMSTNNLLNTNKNTENMEINTNTDLFTIRDEILADLNQFLYLLTLK